MVNSADRKITLLDGEVPLFYRETGEGLETIVFLHGLGSQSRVWSKNVGVLGRYYQCLSLDWPGHGHSPGGAYPYSMDFLADLLIDFLDRRHVARCYLVGHSMGGQVALTAALHHPERFSRLVLAAPAGFETFTEKEKSVLQGVAGRGLKMSPRVMLKAKEQVSAYHPAVATELSEVDHAAIDPKEHRAAVHACMVGMLEGPVFSQLSNLSVPTLVFFGEEDRLIPNRMLHRATPGQVARRGTRRIPGAKLRLLPECGHYVPYEQPVVFNLEIYKFINPDYFS